MEAANIEAMHRPMQVTPGAIIASFANKSIEVIYGRGEKVRGMLTACVEGFLFIQRLDGKRVLIWPSHVVSISEISVQ